MAGTFNIESTDNWFIGEDKTLQIDVKQSDGTTAQSMTGWTLTYEFMDDPAGGAYFTVTPTIGNGSGTDDRATVTITDVNTEVLPNKTATYYHRLRRTDAGNEQVLAYGDVTIKANAGT